jgi:hypothetical protein
MRRQGTTIAVFALRAALAGASSAHAHATYNLQGYGENLAGSIPGQTDGLPVLASGEWTDGPVTEYTGSMSVNWYVGMHTKTQVRTIQTGVPGNAPSGSLAARIANYNSTHDSDLSLATPVIAVGGLSWLDPSTGQGWGHGLDYGLIHFSVVGFDARKKAGAKRCKAADWKNDEPVMTRRTADCAVQRKTKLCVPAS